MVFNFLHWYLALLRAQIRQSQWSSPRSGYCTEMWQGRMQEPQEYYTILYLYLLHELWTRVRINATTLSTEKKPSDWAWESIQGIRFSVYCQQGFLPVSQYWWLMFFLLFSHFSYLWSVIIYSLTHIFFPCFLRHCFLNRHKKDKNASRCSSGSETNILLPPFYHLIYTWFLVMIYR